MVICVKSSLNLSVKLFGKTVTQLLSISAVLVPETCWNKCLASAWHCLRSLSFECVDRHFLLCPIGSFIYFGFQILTCCSSFILQYPRQFTHVNSHFHIMGNPFGNPASIMDKKKIHFPGSSILLRVWSGNFFYNDYFIIIIKYNDII